MKVVLCYSGGLDSTVLLYWLRRQGHEVRCLSVDYGQRHKKELESAYKITNLLNVEYKNIQIGDRLDNILAGSSQTSNSIPVPEGHYEEKSMVTTVVPNRNMILLSLATAWAVSSKSEAVAFAAHSGDHAVYPDCRPEFGDAMGEAIALCDWWTPILLRPFLTPVPMSKTDIVKLGHNLQVLFEKTWSCYKGQDKHCGRCSTCVERLEAFRDAHVTDPTEYTDIEFYKTVTGGRSE